jgi:hypothetical protein
MISREDKMFKLNDAWLATGRNLLIAGCLGMLASSNILAQESVAAMRVVPNALLSIDQNRNTVVERVVRDWGDALAASDAGISVEQLRATLNGMRADYLLAASVAGSLEGLRNVVASSLIGSAPASAKVNAKILPRWRSISPC